jgi:hypothetical protein
VIDRSEARDERHIDGKFLLSSSHDALSAREMAIYYKQLKEVERGWRDQKHVLDLRLIYHPKRTASAPICCSALLLTPRSRGRREGHLAHVRRELKR